MVEKNEGKVFSGGMNKVSVNDCSSSEKLVSWLFETKAIRVCPKDRPFWYTSGTIGPYYINTHFLYGSEEKANSLLKMIDEVKNDKTGCPQKILEAVMENYNNTEIYRALIDELYCFIMEKLDLTEIDCISGGERRDWFFSLIIAKMLKKPHLTIYKDQSVVISDGNGTRMIDDANGMKILHIADLITEASSYERAWIPAIRNIKGEMKWSVSIVDRNQGGAQLLEKYSIKSYSMIHVDANLFDIALIKGLIDLDQHDMLLRYIDNPRESMRQFLLEHPEFLENSLAADERTSQRAKLCLEKDVYGLNLI